MMSARQWHPTPILFAVFLASMLASESMAGTRSAHASGCEITLSPDIASPQSVAAAIKWTATASAECGSQPVFKFSVTRRGDGRFRTVRDYSRRNWFVWNPLDAWGRYRVRAHVKAGFSVELTAESATSESYAILSPWHGGRDPVITNTTHPQVALYSTPPCRRLFRDHGDGADQAIEDDQGNANDQADDGQDADGRSSRSIAVALTAPDGTISQTTWFACNRNKPNNILVSAMLAHTTYVLQTMIRDAHGTVRTLSTRTQYTTGSLSPNMVLPQGEILKGVDANTDREHPILFALAGSAGVDSNQRITSALALDLAGRPLWYWDQPDYAPELNGSGAYRFANGVLRVAGRDEYSPDLRQVATRTVYREVNLTGHPRFETNSDALDAQTSQGSDGFHLVGFHHDAVRLDSGYTVLVAATTKLVTGSPKPISAPGWLPWTTMATCDGSGIPLTMSTHCGPPRLRTTHSVSTARWVTRARPGTHAPTLVRSVRFVSPRAIYTPMRSIRLPEATSSSLIVIKTG